MSTHKQPAKENWFKRNFGWKVSSKRPASSTSQHPDAPNSDDQAIPSTSASHPLPASLTQGNSHVDIVQPNLITNQPSKASTVPGSTGVGEQIGHASCIDRGM